MSDTIQFLVVIIASYLALLMGRAIAARIAGQNNAEMVLNFVPFPFSILTDLVSALPHSRQMDDDQESDEETGNTETPENSGNTLGNTAGNSVSQEFMSLNYNGGQHLAPRMTREEHAELVGVRHDAIALLDRCVKYYHDTQTVDDGTIPRYDKISMKAEHRGTIVDNLWYSTYVVKTKNRTYTDPQYFTTCAALMQAIINNRVRVLPMGYAERKQDILDSAVQILPENVH